MSCPPVKQTAPVFALRMDAVKGAKAASIVCVRLAGLVVVLLDQRMSRSPVRVVDSVLVLRKGAA